MHKQGLVLLALLRLANAHAAAPEVTRTLEARTPIIAALKCREAGYFWFVRITAKYVVCISSPEGVEHPQSVDALLERRP